MKNILFSIALLALYSCSNMTIKIQKIESPVDCVSNDQWSWNNGEAKTTDRHIDGDSYGTFEFKTKLTGVLEFKYTLWTEDHKRSPYLEVSINDEICFEGRETHDTLSVVLKNVPNRAKVIFKGHQCVVKDIMIRSFDYDDSENDPDWHHDF